MDKFSAPTQEARKLKVKLAIAWILSVPVILLQYAFPYIPYREYIQLVLSVPVLFYSGSTFFQGAYQTIRMHTGNMDLLVALGAATAFFFSLFVTLDPRGIPRSSVYFDVFGF
ncbi:cation transporting ATPase, partial [mine drainage metagenome]